MSMVWSARLISNMLKTFRRLYCYVAGSGRAERFDEMMKKIAFSLSLWWLANGMGIKIEWDDIILNSKMVGKKFKIREFEM